MASLEQRQDFHVPGDLGRGAKVLRLHRRGSTLAEDAAGSHLGDDLFARPLARIRAALAADHVAVVDWNADAGHGEVAAAVGAGLMAPGMTLGRVSSHVLDGAADGEVAAHAIADAETGLEILAAAGGLETAMAVPVVSEDGAVRGLVYLAWAGRAAPVEAAQWVIASEAEALSAVLEPPAIMGARVLVCHPDRLVAEGIARQAERRLNVIADSCASLDELLHVLERHRPDLIACSEALCEGEALTAVAARVRSAGAAAPVLALARAETPRSIEEALRAGIAGYVAVTEGADRIMEVMAAVLDGRAVLPSPTTAALAPALTSREAEVLEGLDRGLSYVAIANELQVAPSTVKTHARQLFRKLEVGSRTAALHRARSEGLL
jgi:DNA-binding NarL/FixJ family response regulator